MRVAAGVLAAATIAVVALPSARAVTPEIGWRADLSTLFHGVAGTVTVVDDDTVRVDDFVYDGQGISVFFYLGAEESNAAFRNGLSIGPQLVGPAFDGTQPPLLIDLPGGETIDGYHAISVWCVAVGVSFGEGTFLSPADFSGDGLVNAADLQIWSDGYGVSAGGDANLDGVTDGTDFLAWQQQAGVNAVAAGAVPEPASCFLCAAGIVAGAIALARRRRMAACCG